MIRHIAGTECSPILLSDQPGELLEFLRRRGVPRRRGDLRIHHGAIASVRLSDQEAKRVGRDLVGLPRTSWRELFEKLVVPHLARRLSIPAHKRRIVR